MMNGDRLNLGDLIDALEQQPAKASVLFEFGACVPTTLASYRGYYDDLALGFDDETHPPTVAELLARLCAADGATFTGWKGGEYRMRRSSRLWVANPGKTGGTVIVGVRMDDYERVRLVTGLDCEG